MPTVERERDTLSNSALEYANSRYTSRESILQRIANLGEIELPEEDLGSAELESGETIEHFRERQNRRRDQDRRDEQRRVKSLLDEAFMKMRQRNAGRPPERQADQVCCHCFNDMNTSLENAYRVMNGTICQTCLSNHHEVCAMCGRAEKRNEIQEDTQDRKVCFDCAKQFIRCGGCTTLIERNSEEHQRYIENDRCSCCEGALEDTEDYPNPSTQIMDNNNRPEYRKYSEKNLSSCQSEEKGQIIKSTRVFSAEMETACPSYTKMNRAIAQMPKSMGFCGDGTIQIPSHVGMEFQTPKLAGKKGEEYVNFVCEAMMKNEFATNRTCGLHVHLSGGRDFVAGKKGHIRNKNGENVKKLMLFYMTFEDVIHSFLPQNRRANNFCRPIKKAYHESEILNAPDLAELERVWYRATNYAQVANCKAGGKHSTRYCGVNMHTLLSDNHMEIRYHSGTVNPRKILEWANLHALIMDKIADGSVSQSEIETAGTIINLEDKTTRMFDLVGLTVASKKYFLRRQEKFIAKGDTSEESDIKIN